MIGVTEQCMNKNKIGMKPKNALLQRMERRDPIALWDSVILTGMNCQLRGRPLSNGICGVVFLRGLECGGIPWTSSKFVIEL
jgi:hypothetical protein